MEVDDETNEKRCTNRLCKKGSRGKGKEGKGQ
jgi:hypothetical protein